MEKYRRDKHERRKKIRIKKKLRGKRNEGIKRKTNKKINTTIQGKKTKMKTLIIKTTQILKKKGK